VGQKNWQSKIFDVRRATVFSSEYRLSKRKMTTYSKTRHSGFPIATVANSYTVALEKDFKIDANGALTFMGHFLCGVEQ